MTLRMPKNVVMDLKKFVPMQGFGGYQELMRAYFGSGLRVDMEQLEGSAIAQLIERLREVGGVG